MVLALAIISLIEDSRCHLTPALLLPGRGGAAARPKAEHNSGAAPRMRPGQQQARGREQGASSLSELELTMGAPVVVPPSSVEKPSERHDHMLLASGAAHGAEQSCTRGHEQRHEGQAEKRYPGSIKQTGQSGANYTQPEAEPSQGAVGADSVSRLNDPIRRYVLHLRDLHERSRTGARTRSWQGRQLRPRPLRDEKSQSS